jgi:hypothetical protein
MRVREKSLKIAEEARVQGRCEGTVIVCLAESAAVVQPPRPEMRVSSFQDTASRVKRSSSSRVESTRISVSEAMSRTHPALTFPMRSGESPSQQDPAV